MLTDPLTPNNGKRIIPPMISIRLFFSLELLLLLLSAIACCDGEKHRKIQIYLCEFMPLHV